MRALVQRVNRARVTVGDAEVGAIRTGLLVLIGVTHDDTNAEADLIAAKISHLRVFDDDAGIPNRSAIDLVAAGDQAQILVVSQFTLYADTRRGRRPSFSRAAPQELARPLVDQVVYAIERHGLTVVRGRFGAEMAVELVNDGPYTIWLDTDDLRA